MKALVTGIGGFVGGYLARELLSNGHIVKGICKTQAEIDNASLSIPGEVEFFECDISCQEEVDKVFNSIDIDCVFHLAGIAHVPFAEKNCDLAFSVNTLGTMHVLNSMLKNSVRKIIYISSSEVYGRQGLDGKPFVESSSVIPSNIYGISKASAEMLCSVYSSKYDMKSIIFRPFNHIGPGQNPLFVSSDFASQIAMIEKGDKPPCIHVGNLDVMRDFSDVRDIVNGYTKVAEKVNTNEVFNICSGQKITIKELLDMLLSMSTKPIEVKIDNSKVRKHETYYLGGSHSKLTETTGWVPEIPLEKSLNDILEYWRKKVFSEQVTL